MPFPCGSGPESILHPHGLELLREVLVQTHLREVLPNYLLWHCSRSWSPQSPPSFPQRRLWSVWQLLYWMLLVVHTWLIKIIPLRLYTLIVHSSDKITVHFSEVCKKILEQFFYSFFSADDTDVTKSHLTFRTSSLSGVKTLHCLHNSTCPLSVIDLWSSSTDTVDPSLFKQRPVYINQFEKPYWNSPVYVHTLLQGNVIINRFTKARRANSHSLP